MLCSNTNLSMKRECATITFVHCKRRQFKLRLNAIKLIFKTFTNFTLMYLQCDLTAV